MTDSHDEKNETETAGPSATEGSAGTGSPSDSPPPTENFEVLREKATQAFKAGAAEAKEALIQRFPQVKEDVVRGVGDIAYAVGYAFSFGSALIRQFSDESVVSGFEKGTEAGARAAETTFRPRKDPAPKQPEPDPAAEV